MTRPILFTGNALQANAETSANGSVRFELQDANGSPLPGLALQECRPLLGNSLSHVVRWNSNARLGEYAGKPVRLKAHLEDADLFALQFVER